MHLVPARPMAYPRRPENPPGRFASPRIEAVHVQDAVSFIAMDAHRSELVLDIALWLRFLAGRQRSAEEIAAARALIASASGDIGPAVPALRRQILASSAKWDLARLAPIHDRKPSRFIDAANFSRPMHRYVCRRG